MLNYFITLHKFPYYGLYISIEPLNYVHLHVHDDIRFFTSVVHAQKSSVVLTLWLNHIVVSNLQSLWDCGRMVKDLHVWQTNLNCWYSLHTDRERLLLTSILESAFEGFFCVIVSKLCTVGYSMVVSALWWKYCIMTASLDNNLQHTYGISIQLCVW